MNTGVKLISTADRFSSNLSFLSGASIQDKKTVETIMIFRWSPPNVETCLGTVQLQRTDLESLEKPEETATKVAKLMSVVK